MTRTLGVRSPCTQHNVSRQLLQWARETRFQHLMKGLCRTSYARSGAGGGRASGVQARGAGGGRPHARHRHPLLAPFGCPIQTSNPWVGAGYWWCRPSTNPAAPWASYRAIRLLTHRNDDPTRAVASACPLPALNSQRQCQRRTVAAPGMARYWAASSSGVAPLSWLSCGRRVVLLHRAQDAPCFGGRERRHTPLPPGTCSGCPAPPAPAPRRDTSGCTSLYSCACAGRGQESRLSQ